MCEGEPHYLSSLVGSMSSLGSELSMASSVRTSIHLSGNMCCGIPSRTSVPLCVREHAPTLSLDVRQYSHFTWLNVCGNIAKYIEHCCTRDQEFMV